VVGLIWPWTGSRAGFYENDKGQTGSNIFGEFLEYLIPKFMAQKIKISSKFYTRKQIFLLLRLLYKTLLFLNSLRCQLVSPAHLKIHRRYMVTFITTSTNA
jgi:hypothetical protein